MGVPPSFPSKDDLSERKGLGLVVLPLLDPDTYCYHCLCGDLNLTLKPSMDSYNYVNVNNPKSREKLLESMETNDLVDAFRYFHPDIKRYTWRRRNPIKQAHLDYFIISKNLTDLFSKL